jgi:hypothetical protein
LGLFEEHKTQFTQKERKGKERKRKETFQIAVKFNLILTMNIPRSLIRSILLLLLLHAPLSIAEDITTPFIGASPVVGGVNVVTADAVAARKLKTTTKYNLKCGGHVWATVLSAATQDISLVAPTSGPISTVVS